ncbi:MAG: hypothetical protein QGH12_05345, partial [SAR324 cluster bacterium]|nr:hypothetical protein [SAR324 cluster bacterium]
APGTPEAVNIPELGDSDSVSASAMKVCQQVEACSNSECKHPHTLWKSTGNLKPDWRKEAAEWQ